MWFAEVLSIFFIVFSIFMAVNVWIIIGFAIVMIFDDLDGEVHYNSTVITCFTWPLFVGMTIAKQLQHKKETDGDN